jgi:hypothetical protein
VTRFTPHVKELLRAAGCHLVRQGRGDHEIWESPINDKRFTVDGDIHSRHTANATLKRRSSFRRGAYALFAGAIIIRFGAAQTR